MELFPSEQMNSTPFWDGDHQRCVSPTARVPDIMKSCYSPTSVVGPAESDSIEHFPGSPLSISRNPSQNKTAAGNDHMKEDIVTKPNENDVLCGRGKGPNNHVGNRRFRELVNDYRVTYLATDSRREKGHICEAIIETIQTANPPGRFLIKSSQEGTIGWKRIEYRKAMLKTGQALREGVTKEMIGKIHNEFNADLFSSLSLLRNTGVLKPKMRLPENSTMSQIQLPSLSNLSEQCLGTDSLTFQEHQADGKKLTLKGRLMERAKTDSLSDRSSDDLSTASSLIELKNGLSWEGDN